MRTLDSQIAYYDTGDRPGVSRRPASPHLYLLARIHPASLLRSGPLQSLHVAQPTPRRRTCLDQAARLSGFDVVRGSSRRGGRRGRSAGCSTGVSCSIWPSRRTVPAVRAARWAQGPVYLASKLQMPLVLLGFGFDRPWAGAKLGSVCGPPARKSGSGGRQPRDFGAGRPRTGGTGASSPANRIPAESAHLRSGGLGFVGTTSTGAVQPSARPDSALADAPFSAGPRPPLPSPGRPFAGGRRGVSGSPMSATTSARACTPGAGPSRGIRPPRTYRGPADLPNRRPARCGPVRASG